MKLLALLKMLSDVERMRDECRRIALVATQLTPNDRQGGKFREIRHLARAVQQSPAAFDRLDGPCAGTGGRSCQESLRVHGLRCPRQGLSAHAARSAAGSLRTSNDLASDRQYGLPSLLWRLQRLQVRRALTFQEPPAMAFKVMRE